MQKPSYHPKPRYRAAPATPEQQLQAAIKRAKESNITVAGSGTLSDGRRFWIVASQSVEGMHHVVSEHGKHLECDCFYDRMQHKICAHRASVFLHLQAAAEATKASPTMRAVAEAAVQQAAKPARFDGPRTTNIIRDGDGQRVVESAAPTIKPTRENAYPARYSEPERQPAADGTPAYLYR